MTPALTFAGVVVAEIVALAIIGFVLHRYRATVSPAVYTGIRAFWSLSSVLMLAWIITQAVAA